MKQIELVHQYKHLLLTLFLITCFSFIAARLFQLQIIQHEQFAHSGEKNFIRFKTIPAQRGNILDCNKTPIVTNKPVTNVIWQGTGNHTLTQQQVSIIDTVNKILGTEITAKTVRHAEKFSKSCVLAEKISNKDLCFLAEQCSDTENITFETSYERFYPYKKLACHTIGYLSDAHMFMHGKMGLEKLFEDILKGEPGVIKQHINSFGTLLEHKSIKDQLAGKDLITTIDLSLQKTAEQCMMPHNAGSFILINPQTGAINALVSRPRFDPNILSQKISSDTWQKIQQTRPFVNRAFNASYPPASIFKLVTIAAALEEKLVEADSLFNCKGHVIFKKEKFFCNRHEGHGLISLKESLAFSCNVPCYEIAQHLPIDTLAHYAFELGLGSKTNSIFAEQYGIVPTNEWKIAHKGERWWTGETLSASIGQSFLLTTPIQLARMIGGIFEGFLVKPRILIDQPIEQTLVNISQETREFLQDCMKQVITAGTGHRVNKFLNLIIFAKTGTAQTINRKKRKQIEEHKHHAYFASYFYADNHDPLVLVIFLEHAGGARMATNVAKEFFAQYAKLLESKKKDNLD